MCPPANSPLSQFGLYWSNEQIFALLSEYVPGSHLPSNVIADLSPYEFLPSNLPEGLWYVVHPHDKRESNYGFWKAKNVPFRIYSNSVITGWRTTLEYFEAPHGQRTNWLMEEYSVTRTGLSDKHNLEESMWLCRVFPSKGHSLQSKMNCNTTIESKKMNPVESIDPNIDIISGKEIRIESQGASKVGPVTEPTDEKSNSWPPMLSEQECIRSGDYLALDDLEGHSNSSSSQNSSCPSNVSEYWFDSLALVREIEEDEIKTNQSNQSSSRYNFTTSVRANDVVLQPSSTGMSRTIELVEGLQTGSTEKRVQAHIPERHISDNRNEGTSTPSTSRKNPVPRGRKNPSSDRLKKLKLYFCFSASES